MDDKIWTDRQVGGMIVDDQPVYWNQQICSSRSGAFERYSRTQVSLGRSDSDIVGEIYTYNRGIRGSRIDTTISGDLIDWAWDAHETYTRDKLGFNPTHPGDVSMTDGHASGMMVDGKLVFWNQHLTTSRRSTFLPHTTTQVRLDSSDSDIVGSIHTYDNGHTTIGRSLRIRSEQDLINWAWDAHETYTREHFGFVPTHPGH